MNIAIPQSHIHKKHQKYAEEDMKVAAEEVWVERLTISAAAGHFEVAHTTLADHVHHR